MHILFYLILGLFPGLFWLWFFWLKDRKRPEPPIALFEVFLLGMLVTVPAAFVEFLVDGVVNFSASEDATLALIGMLLVVAPAEEFVKFLVVKKFVYDRGKFNEEFDGVIYAVVAALGFASLENIMAVFTSGPDTLVLRFFTATLLHALTAGVFGYFLGLARFNPVQERALIAKGLIAAIIVHGVYNFILATALSYTFTLILLLLLLVFLMVHVGIAQLQRRDDQVLGE